jgi:Spy/CpxP family protein refolding chaperone
LRAENKSIRDAAQEEDLTEAQADKLHKLVSAEARALERKLGMDEVRELAKLIKQGLL